MKRYSKQDYLDALEGAGPLAWQKDLRALVRDLADEVSRLEKSLEVAEVELEHLQEKLADVEREVNALRDEMADALERLAEAGK